ncbi:hypothetical protein ACJMK2_015180 [Sinanodonta woodiana]|uniref:DZIP3-like HEPN domain-containing protein n=1 Tax=Sinanodonta woodiana TaxID=1069815 RepID=A0ABD3V5A0_SINWO
MFWDNGQLYVTHDRSCDITVFRYVNKGSHKASDVLVSNEGNQSGIGESAIQISQGNVDNGQSSVESEMPPSGKSPEDHEDEKQDSEVPKSDEEKQPVIEGTSTQIGQEIPIEQSVEENLKHAGMKMSTEERDLFIKFQNEIGTDIYFREDDDPETGAYLVTTSVLCWLIKGTSMPLEIFQKLLLACLSRWPVAKKKNTSESLIFQNCTVFDIDLVHRLFLHCDNHAVFARITGMGIDHVNAKMCTRVRKFITLNLTAQDPSIEYQLCVQTIKSQDIQESSMSQPIQMWLAEEVHDPAAPITREHINHSRLCVAIITICGKAMRTILKTYPPAPHRTIEKAILGNKAKLIGRTVDKKGKWSKGVLDSYQSEKLFPDPARKDATSVEKLDISLQYSLIKNITNIKPLSTTWGVVPEDNPRDTSLGANVERIHIFRNSICHSVDGLISQEDFEDYWNKIESVIHDIDEKTGQKFSQDLTNQRKMVISVYEAC